MKTAAKKAKVERKVRLALVTLENALMETQQGRNRVCCILDIDMVKYNVAKRNLATSKTHLSTPSVASFHDRS